MNPDPINRPWPVAAYSSCTVAHFDGEGRPIPCPDSLQVDEEPWPVNPPSDEGVTNFRVLIPWVVALVLVMVAVLWRVVTR